MEKISRIYLFGEEAVEFYNLLDRKPHTINGVEKAFEGTDFEYMVVEREYTEAEHRAYIQGIMDGKTYKKAMIISLKDKVVKEENEDIINDPKRWSYY